MTPGKPVELDFAKDREEIKIFEGSGTNTPVKRPLSLAVIPERGLKLPKPRKPLPNLKDKRTFFMKISTEGKFPPCKLMFSYEK